MQGAVALPSLDPGQLGRINQTQRKLALGYDNLRTGHEMESAGAHQLCC